MIKGIKYLSTTVVAFLVVLSGAVAFSDTINFVQYEKQQRKEIENAFKWTKEANGNLKLQSGLLSIVCDSDVCEVSLPTQNAKLSDYAYTLEETGTDGTRWSGVKIHHQLKSSSRATSLYGLMSKSTKAGKKYKRLAVTTAESSFEVSCDLASPIGPQCVVTLKYKNP